jgi:CRP-like cAMP-binding protein
MEQQWYLSAVDILAALPEKERNFFFEKAVKKTVEKNTVIFSPGDPGTHIYYVVSGRIKIYSLAREGREVIYWFCTPKDFFGLAELCGGAQRTVFAEAVEKTVLLCIGQRHFEELIQRNPEISFALMRVFGSRIRKAHDTIKDLVTCDVRSRVAQLITKLGKVVGEQGEKGIELRNKFTHQEMADMIGATRTTVTEVISSFKRQGLIQYEAGKITILDSRKLLDLIQSAE